MNVTDMIKTISSDAWARQSWVHKHENPLGLAEEFWGGNRCPVLRRGGRSIKWDQETRRWGLLTKGVKSKGVVCRFVEYEYYIDALRELEREEAATQ